MEKKIVLTVLVLAFSTVLPYFVTHKIVGSSPPQVTIHVEPSRLENLIVCDTFEINITVTNVIDLSSFEIHLDYDLPDADRPNMLKFLETEKEDVFRFCKLFENRPEEIDNTLVDHDPNEKTIQVDSFRADTDAATGNVVLATLKFKCMGIGEHAYLIIIRDRTELRTSPPHPEEIPIRVVVDGWYTIKERISEVKLVDQNFTLCTDILDFHEMLLFSIEANNIVLDLDWHTIYNKNGTGTAIYVERKNNVTIMNGVIRNWQWGIEITDCNHVNIINITILDSSNEAVVIKESSNVNICNSRISCSNKEGLILLGCTHSIVSHNVFSNNGKYGIVVKSNSENNTIHNNTIRDNHNSGGMYIHNSNNNTIFNNNFINNTNPFGQTIHVKTDAYSENYWNWTYPCGGNYWGDDYFGLDNYSGKNGRIPGSDGIGDTEYSINAKNKDNYPLMNPYDWNLRLFDEPYSCPVAIFSDSSITNFDGTSFNKRACEMSFDASNGTFCKIIVPKEVSSSALTVLIDDDTAAAILNWDDTHSFINITYKEGNHNVKIIADNSTICLSHLPEWPDLNDDCKINIIDITMVAKEFGKECEKPK